MTQTPGKELVEFIRLGMQLAAKAAPAGTRMLTIDEYESRLLDLLNDYVEDRIRLYEDKHK